ncbi:MAG TPA: MmgE/PrpD family protein [Bryobacteraceae bacterium]|nr:MmgE/PrpD family protein [Bryobacteraceae bacterium]
MRVTQAQQIAEFVLRARYEDLSRLAREQLKIRVLDALGCALGALGSQTMRLIFEHTQEFGGTGLCSLIGGPRTAPDRAAFYNCALVRYLDFNDSYLAKHETCHPSDNLGAVLAACEYADSTGANFLTALAAAYQVQCRLSDVAPVRAKGFDHVTQGAYAVAAGVSKGLGLDAERTANALAIAGAAFNALRVARTGTLSNWKGLAYPNTAFCATHAAFLAMRGVTGPLEVFEGNKGFMDAIAGKFEMDWSKEDLERVAQTIVKRHNAEIHSQSAIEAILELRGQHGFEASDIEQVEVEIFDVAFQIIGGGEEGDKTTVQTKEAADHSLPYLIAVAILDGEVMPEQYRPERIWRSDVQRLLRKVRVTPAADLSERFPREMPCRLMVQLADGRRLRAEKSDYEGFTSRPPNWESAYKKFDRLSEPHLTPALRNRIAETVKSMEKAPVRSLMALLRQAEAAALQQEALQYGGT